MFPGAHSHIYRNEAGEPIGWDNSYYDEPDYDPYGDDDYYDDDYDDEEQIKECRHCGGDHDSELCESDCPEFEYETNQRIKADEDQALMDYENKGHF